MANGPSIKRLHVRHLLSFGEEGIDLELGPLNVLIGPNGSGKSNLIETIGLLQNTPKDLGEPIREGGGISEWLWKGSVSKAPVAEIEALVNLSYPMERSGFRFPSSQAPSVISVIRSIRYSLSFTKANFQLDVVNERIESEVPSPGHERPYLYFGYENGRPMLNVGGNPRFLRRAEINPQQSVLSQRKDPEQYPEVSYLGQLFALIRLYRDWEFGINARSREGCTPDVKVDFLEEDASNFALVVHTLRNNPRVREELIRYMKMFYESATDVHGAVREGGRVEIFLEEVGRFTTPAIRLSDGTLRWIALLTILLHPDPPRVVCIEEPELGLHPDMIRPLAQLLIEASKRMQLIVTTHSDDLIDGLTEVPEAVIVCEKRGASTTVQRLDRPRLTAWLEQYTLGQLWRTGEIGGNRW